MLGAAIENGDTSLTAAVNSWNLFFVEAIQDRGARVTDRDLTAAVEFCVISSSNTELLRRGFLGNAPSAVKSQAVAAHPTDRCGPHESTTAFPGWLVCVALLSIWSGRE